MEGEGKRRESVSRVRGKAEFKKAFVLEEWKELKDDRIPSYL